MENKRLLFISTSRADLGLLRLLIDKARIKFDVHLFVFGNHLDGELLHTSNPDISICNISTTTDVEDKTNLPEYLSELIFTFQSYISTHNFDCAILLGDRWEILTPGHLLVLNGVPIAHMAGGEITYGVVDENIRHAMTKLSNLHYTTNVEHEKNVLQMGEERWRVVNVGEPGLDELYCMEFKPKLELLTAFELVPRKYLYLVTVHPESRLSVEENLQNLKVFLGALDEMNDANAIFTAAGNELGSKLMNQAIQDFVSKRPYTRFVKSLGRTRYLQYLRAADLVLGNSSSGLIEAPSLNTPTINVGARQLGRLAGPSVFHSDWNIHSIKTSITLGLLYVFTGSENENPYDFTGTGGNTSVLLDDLHRKLTKRDLGELLNKKWTKYDF